MSGNSFYGPLDDPAGNAGYDEHPPRVGFFTDTSVCIGCKACEVACKEWNMVPDDGFDLLGMSFDNTGQLGADSWRHVAFIEQPERAPVDLGMPALERPGDASGAETRTDFRWLMSSDVCKHCTHAGCLDVCPTGALFRTEFGTVVVQQDICNGCGYCVSGCPYGVIERREGDGRAWKCTLCYDRLHDGLEPACAKACPTDSIQFGVLERVHDMHAQMHGRGGKGEQLAVPRAEFRSYYGRPVLKKPAWDWKIAAYLFSGGLSAGSAMLAAGADATGRPGLRRVSRVGALVSIVASMYFLVADLGRPERFHHMLRVAKPSSPMSMGTWILSAYSAGAGLAGAAELMPSPLRRTWLGRLVGWLARPAGLWAAGTAPGVASYTAVLLSQTAVPAWREAHPYLPFVFTGSAAASGGGWGMVFAPVDESGPARRMAVAGAGLEVAASRLMEQRLGLSAEAYTTGKAHRLRKWSEYLTVGGALGAVVGRSRAVVAVSGLALLAGSALQRFGVFEAGVESTRDPKYVVVPQRERLDAGRPAG